MHRAECRESERWNSLVAAVRDLGLQPVVEQLASFCRLRRRQRDGEDRFFNAIRAWETDLARLKNKHHNGRFVWPKTH